MIQKLLSLPGGYLNVFHELEGKDFPEWVASTDPPGGRLGSGGGTAHLLAEAWRQAGPESRFEQWLAESRKLMVHAGGRSRRLPAYAAVGKIAAPVPVMGWGRGQRVDQTLIDVQVPFFEELYVRAPESSRVMVCSGDVLLLGQLNSLSIPEADVVCLGMWTSAEKARNHGVFFSPKNRPGELAFVLQKPSPEQIGQHRADYNFLIDTGIWLLSERAVGVLMKKCGWDADQQAFSHGCTGYELYGDFGLGLGTRPVRPDGDVSTLSVAALPLPEGEFYHFGTSRELVASCLQLQNRVLDQFETHGSMVKPHPEMFIQNSDCPTGHLKARNRCLWIENSCVPASWSLEQEHVITGVPENGWALKLPAGMCLDVVPVGQQDLALRVYGINDAFSGAVGSPSTLWCGMPVTEWLGRRGLSLEAAGIDPACDVQEAPLFACVGPEEMSEPFVQWLCSGQVPEAGNEDDFRTRWLRRRLSADALSEQVNLRRVYGQRRRLLQRVLPRLAENSERSLFHCLDLRQCARLYADGGNELPGFAPSTQVLKKMRQSMFCAAVLRHRNDNRWHEAEEKGFSAMRESIISALPRNRVSPKLAVLSDQLVWARSPVRFDFAGGWTDTAPYCLENGGRVVNAAVDLNGQPPIQVYIRRCDHRHIILRSIDMGVEERLASFEDLRQFSQIGSPFSIPKAALCLAGFVPGFCRESFSSLDCQLDAFGGGLEVSIMVAIPKGSGLGTSSVLAATVLGALSDFCSLGWGDIEIGKRVLVLEQMLTTGGGWQDQYGGILRGLKMLETKPGFSQEPVVRWLPEHLLVDQARRSCLLLYYTGITRTAKDILQEVVRGMFLNDRQSLSILDDMQEHARATGDVFNRGDWDGFGACVARSWELNQRLDSGTNPPAVQGILRRISDWMSAGKLLGAGGGGYWFMIAKDPEAAMKIRRTLTLDPPNERARFVDFSVSQTGLVVTRS